MNVELCCFFKHKHRLPGMNRITSEMDKLKLLEEGFSFGLKKLAEKIVRGEYEKKAGDA